MPTEVKRALRTAAGWAANQAAMEALYGVDGYYTTMTAWEADNGGATSADLVTNDELVVLDCYNDWPSALVDNLQTFGFTTSATNNVTINVPQSERHEGTFSTGFRLHTNQYGVLFSPPNFSEVIGLSLRNLNSSGFGIKAQKASKLRNGLFRGSRGSNLSGNGTAGFEASAENCVFIATNASYAALDFGNYAYGAHRLQNSVCVNTAGASKGLDMRNRGTAIVENCYLSGWMKDGVTFTSVRNNAAANGSPPGTSPLTTVITSADFVNSASLDYHLAAGSALIDQGADLSGYFTDDFDGDTRAVPWDIGVDKYPAASGSAPIIGIALRGA
ncbi:MAG: hypothetical protein JKX92_05405 [Porticoccaceae bacterium]|nr:hypothetical protein [Porticoccaceae bacterium]